MKLALHNLDKLMNFATGKDISLAIYLAQYQDDCGLVCGVHYKRAVDTLGMSVSSFYKGLDRLASIGVIELKFDRDIIRTSDVVDVDGRGVDYTLGRSYDNGYGEGETWHYGYWSLKFVDNNFTPIQADADPNNINPNNIDPQEYKNKPYLNVNYEILHRPAFHKLSKSQKIIILNIIKLMNYHKGYSSINLRIETVMGWVCKSRRSVVSMINSLAKNPRINDMVSFILDGNNISIPFGIANVDFKLHERRPTKEADTKTTHAIIFAMHKMRAVLPASIDELRQVADTVCQLMRSYKVMGFSKKVALIMETIKACGFLSAQYIHSLLRSKDREQGTEKQTKQTPLIQHPSSLIQRTQQNHPHPQNHLQSQNNLHPQTI
ncbi:MAG: hypothetical protein FWD97_00420 [Defluviitaleaceae bacterium]|nr:hypothetical protein [Defluviitaleaceae bacterium]